VTARPAHERRRVSIVRLLIVVLLAGALVALAGQWALARVADLRTEVADTWFAPYVDVTLTPALHFEDPSVQPARDVVLGFIVADLTDPCLPSWGTYYSLDAASRALDLDRRIVRLRERGGDAIVSFGGAINSELATVCLGIERLTAAYQSVIDRYGLTTLDFDIEGTSLADAAANGRRAAAIRQLQKTNEGLEVWLTLPVAPHGLGPESVALIEQIMRNGVVLGGVNLMTMNYGASRPPSMSMREATTAALRATWQQLDGAFRRAGSARTEQQLWRLIGATPMIGRNDLAGDVFAPGDAEALVAFAQTVDLGRLSFWSANRDVPCGVGVDDARVSNTCSGVEQEPLEFANVFAGGSSSRQEREPAANSTQFGGDGDPLVRDDPRTSPYPLWRSGKGYEEGAKVVWQGRVYEAKWWSQGDQPDAPVRNAWDTPWRYLGPVLESDRAAVRAGAPVVYGTRPKWAAEKVYLAGDEAEHDKKVFRAKWWTQGDLPQEDPEQPYDHPWEYLGDLAPKSP